MKNVKGAVLTIVIVVIIMMVILVGAVLSLAANQRRAADNLAAHHARAYYRANAGLVDARWRIRVNETAEIGGGDFTDPTFNPAPYYIDIDNDVVDTTLDDGDDVRVDISAVGANQAGVRTIDAHGYE